MKAASFFNSDQQAAILKAIREAEKTTSGEIRVHIETHCTENVLDRAAWIFKKLKMDQTAERNGVLFYLAVEDHKFAILGDAGINSKVPAGFWDEIRTLLQSEFSEGRFTEGLAEGIMLAGQQLKTHFPFRFDDRNELSDEISFKKHLEEEK
jgi:uncharacterized membrane protein